MTGLEILLLGLAAVVFSILVEVALQLLALRRRRRRARAGAR